jgi:hypothetical protein
MPAPVTPAHRIVPGTVSELLATPCGTANRPRGTCFRPVVDYTDQGQAKQTVSRTRYSDPPCRRGDRVDVFVESNGTAWNAAEWEARAAKNQDQYKRTRDFPLTMGWILVGCAAFGILLGFGLIFFVDRRGDVAPQR